MQERISRCMEESPQLDRMGKKSRASFPQLRPKKKTEQHQPSTRLLEKQQQQQEEDAGQTAPSKT